MLTGKLSRLFRFMQEIEAQLDILFGRRFVIPEHADYATAIGAARHARSRIAESHSLSCFQTHPRRGLECARLGAPCIRARQFRES